MQLSCPLLISPALHSSPASILASPPLDATQHRLTARWRKKTMKRPLAFSMQPCLCPPSPLSEMPLSSELGLTCGCWPRDCNPAFWLNILQHTLVVTDCSCSLLAEWKTGDRTARTGGKGGGGDSATRVTGREGEGLEELCLSF